MAQCMSAGKHTSGSSSPWSQRRPRLLRSKVALHRYLHRRQDLGEVLRLFHHNRHVWQSHQAFAVGLQGTHKGEWAGPLGSVPCVLAGLRQPSYMRATF
jgi:hypothetical protein